ncbi:hypothetical protein GJAV_G00023240 [Gymnothorax javanicus]|nr:hypothetical protein GJAV_G00023240 [Gymnothorax javanicus]
MDSASKVDVFQQRRKPQITLRLKMADKRSRKPNWTKEETMILLEEYNKRKHILRSKFNPAITSIKKQQMWLEIADKINARTYVKRSVREVLKKIDNMSVLAKKEMGTLRNECIKTDEDPAPVCFPEETAVTLETLETDSPTLDEIISEEQSGTEMDTMPPCDISDPGERWTPPTVCPPQAAQLSQSYSCDVLQLQKEVLLLQKEKIKLQMLNLGVERENLQMQNMLLRQQLGISADDKSSLSLTAAPCEE